MYPEISDGEPSGCCRRTNTATTNVRSNVIEIERRRTRGRISLRWRTGRARSAQLTNRYWPCEPRGSSPCPEAPGAAGRDRTGCWLAIESVLSTLRLPSAARALAVESVSVRALSLFRARPPVDRRRFVCAARRMRNVRLDIFGKNRGRNMPCPMKWR